MQKSVRDLMITLTAAAEKLKAAAEPDVYISRADFSTLQKSVEGDERELITVLYQLLREREDPNGRLTQSDVDAALIELQSDLIMGYELAPGPLSESENQRFLAISNTHQALASLIKKTATPASMTSYADIARELEGLSEGLAFGDVFAPDGHTPFEGIYIPAGIGDINRRNFLPAIAQVERFEGWDVIYRNVRSEPATRLMASFEELQIVEKREQAKTFIDYFRTGLDRHEIITVEENEPGSGYPVFWIGFTPDDDWVGLFTLTYRNR